MQHVFISYMHENTDIVDRLCQELTSRGIKVWLDRNDIKPGSRWKDAIREAIRKGDFFIACFSKEYNKRNKTYMNEELTVAIEELRQRPTDRVWFIPVKLNGCKIPDRNIGGGETLNDIQHVKLYKDWDNGIQHIIDVIQSESSDQNGAVEPSENFTDQRGVSAESNSIDSARNSELTEWIFQQGNFLLRHKHIDKAVEAYSHAIDLDPNNADTYNNSGLTDLIKGEVEHAIEKFNRAIELRPDFAAAYNNRGMAYGKRDNMERAIEDCSTAIKLEPTDASAYNNRGNAYCAIGNVEHAIKDYAKAIKLKAK